MSINKIIKMHTFLSAELNLRLHTVGGHQACKSFALAIAELMGTGPQCVVTVDKVKRKLKVIIVVACMTCLNSSAVNIM